VLDEFDGLPIFSMDSAVHVPQRMLRQSAAEATTEVFIRCVGNHVDQSLSKESKGQGNRRQATSKLREGPRS
jgi:hypothetical protein